MGFIKQIESVPAGTPYLTDSSTGFLSNSNGMVMDVQDPSPTSEFDYAPPMANDILAYPLVQVQLAEPPKQTTSDSAIVTEICSLISKLTPDQLHQVLLLVNSQEPEQMVKSDVEWVFDLNALKPMTCQLILNFIRTMTQPLPPQIYAPAPAFLVPTETFYQSPMSYVPSSMLMNSSTESLANTKKRKEAPLRTSVELLLDESRKRRTFEPKPATPPSSEDMAVDEVSFTSQPAAPAVSFVPAPSFTFAPAGMPEMMPTFVSPAASFPTSPTSNDMPSEDEDFDSAEADGEWTPQATGLSGLTRLPNGKFQLEVEIVDLRDAKTGQSEWTCPICNRIFTDSSNFNKHTLRHTTEKPAVCTFEGCGKRFTHTSTLKDHIDAIHLQIRKYKCNWPGCNKAFSNQSNKSRHMRTHNGQKPYTCNLCNKSFSQSSNLKVHLKTHEKK